MERTQWTDRRFNFDFPVGLFPVIMERLRGTYYRLNGMTSGLSNELLEYKPYGKWSIKENIGHLTDLELLHDGRITDFLERTPVLKAADMTNKLTNEAHHNDESLSGLLFNFNNFRNSLLTRFEQMEDSMHEITSLHPRLKILMRPVDMAFFIAEHDDHHLTGIRDIIRELKDQVR